MTDSPNEEDSLVPQESASGRWDGVFTGSNAIQTAEILLVEATYQREAQNQGVDDLRKRSVTVLTIVSGAVLLVAGFAEVDTISDAFLGVAATAVCLLVGCAIQVHRPRKGYYLGPPVDVVAAESFGQGDHVALVMRDMATWHAENVERNQTGPIKRIQLWFTIELVAAGLTVVAVLLGLATVASDAEESTPATEAQSFRTQQAWDEEQSVATTAWYAWSIPAASEAKSVDRHA